MGWMGDFSIIISVLNKNKFLFFSFIYENKEINNKNLNIIANLNNKINCADWKAMKLSGTWQ